MQAQTRTCQNCKQEFRIEPEDFEFYEKIKVPPPTFCPECRFIRRMSWRNERSLYKRFCDLCKKNIIAMYPPDVPFPVYCRECWWSDKWDPAAYGRVYDFSRPFFEQIKELRSVVPRLALWQRNVINSDFSNMVGECKNVYLSVSVVAESEDVAYSKSVDMSRGILDSRNVAGSENCYENIDGEKNFSSHYLILSRNCIDSQYLLDCVNCRNCVLSSNLRNKEYCIRNKQYSKEGYFAELNKLNLGSRTSRDIIWKEFVDIAKGSLYRFAYIIKSQESTGNNILNAKNCKYSFDVYDMEDTKYCHRAFGLKDTMDLDFGSNSELMYEYNTGARNCSNVRFTYSAMDGIRDAEYTDSCLACSNIFGCVGLKNKENAILNKVYSKEEFVALRKKIIEHMNNTPYVGGGGREYRYGEFFPVELSSYAYNETCAHDFQTLDKEEVLKRGYRWREPEAKDHSVTIPANEIPDDIRQVQENILKEVLGCADEGRCNHQCSVAFRLIPDELKFYKKNLIPIPDKCPNCRYYIRAAKMPPPKLWHRKCMCAGAKSENGVYKNTIEHFHKSTHCPNEFETSYASERPEIVYCEQGYQAEVV